jgi:hypothetical protein
VVSKFVTPIPAQAVYPAVMAAVTTVSTAV